MGRYKNWLKWDSVMNRMCPSAHFFYLWSISYPTQFSVPVLHPLLDYFETNTEMSGKNFCLYRDILEDITVAHREQKGDDTYILKEKGEKRRGEKKGQIGIVVRKGGTHPIILYYLL